MHQRMVMVHIAVVAFCAPLSAQIGNIVVTSAANFTTGVPSRGSLASVFCTGLKLSQNIVSAQALPLPYELDAVQVRVNGVPAPLLAVAELGGFQQINSQVPMLAEELPQEVDIAIHQGELRGAALALSLTASPGEFFRKPTGAAVLQHAADYSLVTEEHPARADEIIIAYLTGMPVTTPTVREGAAAPFDPLAIVPQYSFGAGIESYRLFVEGVLVQPLFVGLAPSLVGVYQVNFRVPAGVQAGTRQLVMERLSCRAALGSCTNGGGTTRTYRSQPATITIH